MSLWERWVQKWIPERAQQAMLLAVLLFGSVFSYLVISNFLLGLVEVTGTSMEPTLVEGETYVLHKWRVRLQAPKRGHIVAILDPLDNGYSVKRIVGLPLEEVALNDGAVTVDGTVLPEPYLAKETQTLPYVDYPSVFRMGEGEYLVLGDNRSASLDGRVYGPIPRKRILGVLYR